LWRRKRQGERHRADVSATWRLHRLDGILRTYRTQARVTTAITRSFRTRCATVWRLRGNLSRRRRCGCSAPRGGTRRACPIGGHYVGGYNLRFFQTGFARAVRISMQWSETS
jgi:hypothetical protein